MTKKLYMDQTIAGPGILTSSYQSSSFQYIDGENVEVVKTITNLMVDHNQIAQMLAMPGNPLYTSIQQMLLNMMKTDLNIEIVPWSTESLTYKVKLKDEVIADIDYVVDKD